MSAAPGSGSLALSTAGARARGTALVTPPHRLACPECGLFQILPGMAAGEVARCMRCQTVLRRSRRDPIGLPLALNCAGLGLFLIACFMSLMSVSTAGIFHSADLLSGPIGLERHGVWELSAVVLFTTMGAPCFLLAARIYVLAGVRMERPPLHLRQIFGWIERLRPWSMIEVYLLGVFVAYVKLRDLVHIEVGIALYALCALTVIMVAADAFLDPYAVWEEMARRQVPDVSEDGPPAGAALAPARPGAVRLISCHTCGQVSRPLDEGRCRCPRCGSVLHRRKPNAIARTWALVIASIILYVPANLYPVLTVVQLGSGQPSTILGGVEELLTGGLWPLALLVFFASIMVPVLKLIGLLILLITTQRGSAARLRDRTVLYRIVSAIGRWSMIDIFMESILVALVQFGALVTINPGVGAVAFAGVVVLTMFAAESFDPRLIWDKAGRNPP